MTVLGPAPRGGVLVGRATITRSDAHTLVVARLPAATAAMVGGLPRSGTAVVAVAVPDGDGVVAERGVALHVVDDGPASPQQRGALKLRLLPDTFGEPRQLVIVSPGVEALRGAGEHRLELVAPQGDRTAQRGAVELGRLVVSEERR